MPVDQSRSATFRRLQKPVLESRLLDDMESPDPWRHFGPGEMSFTQERCRDGKQSVRLVSPTKTPKPGPVMGRPFSETGVRREFADEDWSLFNRISFWVYPTLPGFKVISLLVKFRAEGSDRWSYTHGALHHVLLKNAQWNHVVWEIPHLERSRVRSIDLIYRLQGNEPEATNRVCFDFDQLKLDRVEADAVEGWAVAPRELAYNHLGYAPEASKIALGTGLGQGPFDVVCLDSMQSVFRGIPRHEITALGEFDLLDFTALTRPGRYALKVDDRLLPEFVIHANAWRRAVEATLNLFYCQRCGTEIPGIHGVCHRDWQGVHGDQRIIINGGWHDAGDLSQGMINTAEAAYAMLRLVPILASIDASLARRCLVEARWGLDWLLKTRFEDGTRVTWATMDFWTDGILGTVDDVTAEARSGPHDHFTAAATLARAARIFREQDPIFANHCLETAMADWQRGNARTGVNSVEVASAGVQAGIELYRATQDQACAEKAVELAKVLTQSQERAVRPWRLPLTGFFYTSPEKTRPLHYNHRSHEQAPIQALADLAEAFPDHADFGEWHATIALYAHYLKTASQTTAPYHMLPAGVYRRDEARDDRARAQLDNGIPLDSEFVLRRFPVWGDFRGNLGVQLSQAKALSVAGRHCADPESLALAREQVDWTLGRNPFAQSLMYGVGHGYAPQYTAASGDITGSLPVGIQSRFDEDEPYWPASNCYNYAELWVHPSSRLLGILSDLDDPRFISGDAPVTLTSEGLENGRIRLRATWKGGDKSPVSRLLTSNLRVETPTPVRQRENKTWTVEWIVHPIKAGEAWVALVWPEDQWHRRADMVGTGLANAGRADPVLNSP